jgi:hypothetical protein
MSKEKTMSILLKPLLRTNPLPHKTLGISGCNGNKKQENKSCPQNRKELGDMGERIREMER